MICLKAGAKLRIIFELTADYADFTVFSGNKSRFCRFYLNNLYNLRNLRLFRKAVLRCRHWVL